MPSLTKIQTGFMEAQGALPLSSGTAAAPGLKFSDHAGTGMFSPSTGAIGLSTSNKQNALTIHTDGSVVINGTTSNVVGRLTVAGDGKDIVFGRTESTGTGGTGRLVATGNIVYVQAGQNASSGSAADLVFGAYGGVGEKMRIASDNNITVGYNGASLWLKNGFNNSSARMQNGGASGSADLKFYTNDAGTERERLRISSTGQIGMGKAGAVTPNGNSPLTIQESDSNSETICLRATTSGGNGSQPGIVMKTAAGGHIGGIYCDVNSDYMRLSTSGDDRIIITNTGKIGINDTNPERAVDIRADNCMVQLQGTGGGGRQYSLCSTDNTTGAAVGSAGSFVIYDDTSSTARLNITSDGTVHINSADSASGGRIYAASSKLYLQSGNGRQSFNIADMAAGSTATHEFNSSGNLILAGGMEAASVNLQSSSTSSWFQTGTSLYSTNYVWAAKDSSSNTWHSGLQTDGDLLLGNVLNDTRIGIYGSSGNIGLKNATTSAKLNVQTDVSGNYTGWKEKGVASGSMSQASIDSKTPTINDFTYPNSSNGMLIWSTSKIGFAAGGESPQYGTGVQMLFDSAGLMLGGNRAFDRTSSTSNSTNYTVRLKTNGTGVFTSSLQANSFYLTSSDSWIQSAYGAITNSTVSTYNNLLIGQNMRGHIKSIDGSTNTNNFYHTTTHGGMGYCGTEYYYGGIIKFYAGTGSTSANTTFTPTTRMTIASDIEVLSGTKFKQNNNSNFAGGMRTYHKQGYAQGNHALSMTFTVASSQNTYLVIAGFNHYGLLSYGATYMAFASTGPSGPTSNVINNNGTSLGGTWSVSQTSQTQLTVAKSAGSYNGGGYWFVHILSST